MAFVETSAGGRERAASLRALLFLIPLLCAAPVRADSQSLAVLGLSSDDDEDMAAEVTEALRSEAKDDPEFKLSNSRVSLSQMTMAQDCDITEAPCRGRIAKALDVQQVIYGEVHRAGARGYDVDVYMFAAGGAGTKAHRTIPPTDTGRVALAAHARALLHRLAGSDDLEAPVHEPTPAPSVVPDVSPLSDSESAPAHAAAQPSGPSSNDWIGYTLLGVAGVSLGLTIFSWTQISAATHDDDFKTYQTAVGKIKPSVKDVCDEADAGNSYGVGLQTLAGAHDACSRGKTFERLQFVFVGAMLLSAGIGTYFLLDGDSAGSEHARVKDRRFALQPSFDRYGASLGVRFRL